MTTDPRPSPLPPAIVAGLDNMTGIQTARILARHGIPVIALAGDPTHPACRTNVLDELILADLSSAAFVDTLVDLGPNFDQKPVLFPCTDHTVHHISAHRDRLAPFYHIILPGHDVVEMLMDKNRLADYARENGFRIPATRLLTSRAGARQAAAELTFPVILKPAVKAPDWMERTGDKVHQAGDPAAFLRLYDRVHPFADLLMVQEWIPGPDANLYSCNCYFSREGELLVTFIARKLRQWPPQAGTSCLGEEVRNDDVLQESVRLFRGVGYRGLGYLEMKRHARTGDHYLIEPNIGRPTGRSAIAEAGGVPLLYTMYCDAAGLPLPAGREQRYTGVKWIYLRRDLQSAHYYWRRGELTFAQWRDSIRGPKGYALYDPSDMRPFLADLSTALAKGLRSLPRKLRRLLPFTRRTIPITPTSNS
jgi:D-aspartate ligase